LHRKLLDWEWYDDVNVSRLFIHCLLRANHKPKKWMGKVIPAGSFISGRIKLSEETGLSERQIRTCLSKLKSTSDLTIQSTNRNSLITVTGWASYQDKDQQATSKTAIEKSNKRPTDDQQATTNNNVNNDNNDNNVNNKQAVAKTPDWVDDYKKVFWSTYLKKVDKKPAMELLTKLINKKPEHDYWVNVLQRVEQKSQVDTDKQFWPSPVRYLRDCKWDDELINKIPTSKADTSALIAAQRNAELFGESIPTEKEVFGEDYGKTIHQPRENQISGIGSDIRSFE